MASSFWNCFLKELAEKCRQFVQILEREDREFEEVMREQVGNVFPSTNSLDNVESLKCLLILVLLSIVKQNENSGYDCL